ncbi:AraC family transcriptional regulator [Sinorhizobium alkalisoli]|uniref:AraC family transcriptional regulator n=1 Tax=Sinorhizobium alkalisoli TaxID=1752398 RepID=A0A1E3VCC9_9HYPH|nr:AraC family transcriptional regulator [Sinorhizobium alkalisoli]QFI66721.1 Transcriptional regulator, AraC family [Sinorhizobium alkalisoli]
MSDTPERLTDPPSVKKGKRSLEALLDLLRAMRLTGGIFLDAKFSAPWSVSAKVAPEDCAPFTVAPRHIIAYHYVTEGRCLLKVGDERPIEVESGEIVVLPRNDRHVIASAMNLRPVSADHLIQAAPEGGPAKIVHGGGGERTSILCGFLGNDLAHNALIALLPSVLKLDATDGASGDWIKGTFHFAARELAAGQANSPMILAKLAELLFMEAVRRYLAFQPTSANAWAAGMQDQVIGRALGLLHGQIARRWTTEDLARELSVSRSAFAERFTRAIGEPPMRYLARQRFEQASAQLKETADPIARIAYDVGYESEEAFSRAFRREYGMPPAAWRRANALAGS